MALVYGVPGDSLSKWKESVKKQKRRSEISLLFSLLSGAICLILIVSFVVRDHALYQKESIFSDKVSNEQDHYSTLETTYAESKYYFDHNFSFSPEQKKDLDIIESEIQNDQAHMNAFESPMTILNTLITFLSLYLVFDFILFSILINKIFGYKQDIERKKQGLEAELEIGNALNNLPDEFVVLHDLHMGDENVDHVVIGTKNIFIVETKSHNAIVDTRNGHMAINGRRTYKITQQVNRQIFWLKEIVEPILNQNIYVQGLIVFSRAKVNVRNNTNIDIISSKYLLNNIIKKDKKGVLLPQNKIKEIIMSLTENDLH